MTINNSISTHEGSIPFARSPLKTEVSGVNSQNASIHGSSRWRRWLLPNCNRSSLNTTGHHRVYPVVTPTERVVPPVELLPVLFCQWRSSGETRLVFAKGPRWLNFS